MICAILMKNSFTATAGLNINHGGIIFVGLLSGIDGVVIPLSLKIILPIRMATTPIKTLMTVFILNFTFAISRVVLLVSFFLLNNLDRLPWINTGCCTKDE